MSSQGATDVVHKNEAAQMNITMADTDDTSEVNEEIELSQVATCDTMDPLFQLQRAERELLISCTQDNYFKKKTGNLDWDKIENFFADKADGCKIFKRSRKRL